VLDGEPSHPPYERGRAAPTFGSCLLWQNSWMYQDATWYGGLDIGPGDIVLDGDPAPPTERGTGAPTFRPTSIVAKRSPTSSTALYGG